MVISFSRASNSIGLEAGRGVRWDILETHAIGTRGHPEKPGLTGDIVASLGTCPSCVSAGWCC